MKEKGGSWQGLAPILQLSKKLKVTNRGSGQAGECSGSVSIADLQRSESEGLDGQCGPTAGTESWSWAWSNLVFSTALLLKHVGGSSAFVLLKQFRGSRSRALREMV